MKRLFLTHFCFTTGPNELEHQLYRLTVLTKEDVEGSPMNQPDDVLATAKAVAWFEINYPESRLKSAIAFSAIEKIEKEDAFVLQNKVNYQPNHIEESPFVRSFGPDEFPHFDDGEESASIDVLIDPDGYRKKFHIGYYSFVDKCWKYETNAGNVEDYGKNLRWFMPPYSNTHNDYSRLTDLTEEDLWAKHSQLTNDGSRKITEGSFKAAIREARK